MPIVSPGLVGVVVVGLGVVVGVAVVVVGVVVVGVVGAVLVSVSVAPVPKLFGSVSLVSEDYSETFAAPPKFLLACF